MSKAYVLNWDLSLLGDDEFDASLVSFPGSDEIVRFSSTENYALPDMIYFYANFKKLQITDFPYNDANWPIFSTRIIEVLESIDSVELELKKIPVTMLDDSVSLDKEGVPHHSGKENHDFVAIQLLQHLKVIDFDNSVCEIDEDFPDIIEYAEKIVLKEPINGFPLLFRLLEYPIPLLVSSEARFALEKASIKGLIFEDLNSYIW